MRRGVVPSRREAGGEGAIQAGLGAVPGDHPVDGRVRSGLRMVAVVGEFCTARASPRPDSVGVEQLRRDGLGG